MLGKQSFQFTCKPYIISSASIVGKKEAEGPMGKLFDKVGYDKHSVKSRQHKWFLQTGNMKNFIMENWSR